MFDLFYDKKHLQVSNEMKDIMTELRCFLSAYWYAIRCTLLTTDPQNVPDTLQFCIPFS